MGSPVRKITPRITFDYKKAFSRNIGVVSESEQETLRNKHVAIPGCGGVGSIHALTLARMGIGNFTLADFDEYAIENFNRQVAAKVSTIGLKKVEVVRDEILEINPTAKVRLFSEAIGEDNIEAFLEGVDLVVDSLDFFAFSARDVLFPAVQKKGLWLVTAAPLGLSCAILVFSGDSMDYWRYFDFKSTDSRVIRAIKFAVGLAPAGLHIPYMDRTRIDLENGKGPSHVIGVTECSAMASGEVLKILLKKGSVRAVPHYTQFDVFRGKYRRGILWRGNRNPWQRLKMWYIRRFLLKNVR